MLVIVAPEVAQAVRVYIFRGVYVSVVDSASKLKRC